MLFTGASHSCLALKVRWLRCSLSGGLKSIKRSNVAVEARHNESQHYDINCDIQPIILLFRMNLFLLCWVSVCWMLSCWVSFYCMLSCWISWECCHAGPCYAKCHHPVLLCWESWCWVSLCWVSLCWITLLSVAEPFYLFSVFSIEILVNTTISIVFNFKEVLKNIWTTGQSFLRTV